jgi:hypothetical protein
MHESNPSAEKQLMPTKLEKTLKREIQINGEPHIATISPEGVKITKKGFRKGNEVTWAAIASGDANLRSDLSKSVDATMTEPGE